MTTVNRYDIVVARGLCKECADKLLAELNRYAWLVHEKVPSHYDTKCTMCHKDSK